MNPKHLGCVLAALLLPLSGCAGQTSRTRVDAGRAEIHQESKTQTPTIAHEDRTIEHLTPDGKVDSVERVRRVETGGTTIESRAQGVSQGAGVDTTAGDIAQKFNGSAPELKLPGGAEAKGGNADSDTDAKTVVPKSLWSNPLVWVGVFCLLGSGVGIYFGLRRAAAVSGGVGLALLIGGFFPAVLLFVAAAVLAVLVGVYIYAERHGQNGREALRAVVAGVAGLPAEAKAAVTEKIAEHADETDKTTIRAVKRQDGIQ